MASPEADSARRTSQVEAEVRRAVIEHLDCRDAETALDHFEPDAVIASNGALYPSFEAFSAEIREFYASLRQVHVAVWDDIHVDVLTPDAALVNALFRWSSTDDSETKIEVRGVWTALYVRRDGVWRIRLRHESFTTTEAS